MNLIDKVNVYFGTEFKSVTEFIKDFRKGELSTEYQDDQEKVTHLLMFINALGREE
ncbi:hypothetical protein ANABIO32_02510 [Rossellomorea marisflavi]|uniref:hypothetical protein n=1 Tax=Rossellomorea marisflavi TaxID=189381 RepID=UPI0025C91028|nr:hypothetical protein [Rossellomorea marisflavi]GLI82564.1 hypothetical protein ANABIO32_02510 [Rossellomorea marisflavi]